MHPPKGCRTERAPVAANTDSAIRLARFTTPVGRLFSKVWVVVQNGAMVREITDPEGIRVARTLPAGWYGDPQHHAVEMDRVFRQGWVCAGVTDDLPEPGSWRGAKAV